jgi:hypothetical protein
MYSADRPHDSNREPAPRTTRRAEDEVVVERTPIIADGPTGENDLPSATLASERRRTERRRIDRMSTGI